MRNIARKAWSETAINQVKRHIPDLQDIAASLAGIGHILSNSTFSALGVELYEFSLTLDEARPSLEYFPQEESTEPTPAPSFSNENEAFDQEEIEALKRGISVAQTREDLKSCADTLRGMALPKGSSLAKSFVRLLLERAKELGIEPEKAPGREPGSDDDLEEETPAPAPIKPAPLHVRTQVERSQDVHKVFNPENLPIITNPPRNPQQKAINTEKGRREVFEQLVKTGKLGLPENDYGAIDDIAATLLSCRSLKDLELAKKNSTKFQMSVAAREQVQAIIEMRAGHIKEAIEEAAKKEGEK